MLLRTALPSHWVIHEYTPDYGIDGTVEVFDYVDSDEQYAETLGETFFFQLKSVEKSAPVAVALPGRYNVEKGPYREDASEAIQSQVVKFQLETDELLTIEAMGAGVVVVMFLVCLDTQTVYFVNLTDTIDKVLTPETPDWREQMSKSVRLPVLNELSPNTPVLSLLRFYGARPKLMGLFSKIHFQWAELVVLC